MSQSKEEILLYSVVMSASINLLSPKLVLVRQDIVTYEGRKYWSG